MSNHGLGRWPRNGCCWPRFARIVPTGWPDLPVDPGGLKIGLCYFYDDKAPATGHVSSICSLIILWKFLLTHFLFALFFLLIIIFLFRFWCNQTNHMRLKIYKGRFCTSLKFQRLHVFTSIFCFAPIFYSCFILIVCRWFRDVMQWKL